MAALGAPRRAALIGRAAAAMSRDPSSWTAFGAPAEVLQQLKYLWHILVLRGGPSDRAIADASW